ncbi:MAG TPA: ATP synthase F1 subunit gamma [Solirubrobacteraceae bacterium]|jgi:F-type H+-transporting ATPase subunit gamma|nr:ATP synthase F1 subunit gamma [Solirubrobacteraceae bacterium]
MPSQRDVKNRIASVQNIRKITRAMEMVAAARLRRAEQRIAELRPYADALRRMTRQAADAAGAAEVQRLPLLAEHESERKIGLLLMTADRGLAGAFNSQIIRAGIRTGDELSGEGKELRWYASGRRGVSSLTFRGREVAGGYTGFTERPSFADARSIADDLMTAYIDGQVDRVEVFYNGYISPLTQRVTRETLLPLAHATILGEESEEGGEEKKGARALVEYEPDPQLILQRLVPDYVEISIYRALLESTASELGARMTAMRNASENAGDLIQDLTLEMNRARQAEITQEIMEVVAGAEGLS